ncbi:MAG: PKD domain-containing protein [bacterium]
MTIFYVRAVDGPAAWHAGDPNLRTCDGTADQTEINAAIDAAKAAGGGSSVECSEGTFWCSGAVVHKGVALLKGQGKSGAGGTFFRFSSPSGQNSIAMNVAGGNLEDICLTTYGRVYILTSNHTFTNVRCFETGPTSGEMACFVVYAENETIQDLTFDSCDCIDPQRYGFWMGGVEPCKVKDIHYLDCLAQNCGRYGRALSPDWQNGFDIMENPAGIAENVTYENCTCTGSWESGWYSEGGATLINVQLINCAARDCGQVEWSGAGSAAQGAGYLIQGSATLTNCLASGNIRDVLLYYAGAVTGVATNFQSEGGSKVGIATYRRSTYTGGWTFNGGTFLDCTDPVIPVNTTCTLALNDVAFTSSSPTAHDAITTSAGATTLICTRCAFTNYRYGVRNPASPCSSSKPTLVDCAFYGTYTAPGYICCTVSGSYPSNPDLVVTDISLSPSSPTVGQAVTFSAVVKNNGNAATPAGVVHGVRFTVDDDAGIVRTATAHTASIAAGASVVIAASSTWAATTGAHHVDAEVDYAELIDEQNEDNNAFAKSFSVGSAPPVTPPVANFTYSVAGKTVTFHDTSTNTPTSWDYDCDDGTAHETTQNPVHVYAAYGTYDVHLHATNAGGTGQVTKTIILTAPPLAPAAAFSHSILEHTTVGFEDTSTETPSSWFWNFGDGHSSNQQDPTHVYASSGTYTVTLTATNANGSDTHSMEISIPTEVVPKRLRRSATVQ